MISYEDLDILQKKNLYQHLKVHGIEDAVLFGPSGEVEFSLRDPVHTD